MRATVEDGWLSVPCDAGDMARVHLAVGEDPIDWVGAFRDFNARGQRTAQIPYAPGYLDRVVWLRVDGVITPFGAVKT